jgi:DNA-binding response OmpR family regulator
MQKILIVDDNVYLSRVMHHVLKGQPFVTQSASSVNQALKYLESHRYDLLVLDRVLPDGDGLEVLEYLHHMNLELPVLMISEKSAAEERILGLRQGADDYLGKPFSIEEFRLKVEKMTYKIKNASEKILQMHNIFLDEHAGTLQVGKKKSHLRKKELIILLFLLKHRNRLVTRESMIENLWVGEEVPTFATIDVYVRRLRIFLGKKRGLIKTVRGYGYLFNDARRSAQKGGKRPVAEVLPVM